MKILFVVNYLETGGAETFLLRLAAALATNHEIGIFELIPNLRNQVLVDSYLRRTQVKIESRDLPNWVDNIFWRLNGIGVRLGYENWRFHLISKIQRRNLRRVIRINKYEIANSHLFLSDEFISKSGLKIPHVISMHGCYESRLYGSYIPEKQSKNVNEKFINEARRIIGSVNHVIIAAEKNRLIFDFINVNHQKISKIYYGVSLEQESFGSNKRKLEKPVKFCMVARGIESKGWEVGIEAAKKLIESNHLIELHLVYPESDYMQKLKKKYINIKQINFIGFLAQPTDHIKKCDIGILPTYFPSESLPNSIIEYLVCQKPVIASNIGEIPIMLQASEKGDLAGILLSLESNNAKPAVEHLSEAMLRYVHNTSLIDEHSDLAKSALKKFDMINCLEKYGNIFKLEIEKSRGLG